MINKPVELFVSKVIARAKIAYPIFGMQELVGCLGGNIYFAEDKTLYPQGLVRKHGEGFQIYMSAGMPELSEKFFIAKLLGYLFMEMGYKMNAEKWENAETFPPSTPLTKEMLARMDYFASALLMPSKLFIEKFEQYERGDTERQLNLMVKFFKVSRDKVINRLIQLDHFD